MMKRSCGASGCVALLPLPPPPPPPLSSLVRLKAWCPVVTWMLALLIFNCHCNPLHSRTANAPFEIQAEKQGRGRWQRESSEEGGGPFQFGALHSGVYIQKDLANWNVNHSSWNQITAQKITGRHSINNTSIWWGRAETILLSLGPTSTGNCKCSGGPSTV